jgi:hypothetical protein
LNNTSPQKVNSIRTTHNSILIPICGSESSTRIAL